MNTAPKPHPAMSDYEASAWHRLLEHVTRRERKRDVRPIRKAEELAALASARLDTMLDDHQQLKTIVDGMNKPLLGLQELLQRVSVVTVSEARLLRRAGRRNSEVMSLADLRRSDLELPDRLLSRHNFAYGLGMAAEGAGTSLLITGAVVSSTVTGGTTMAVAASAVSIDVAANLAVASRVVAEIAMAYGYDVRLPDEQRYALGVLNYGTTVTAGGKAASLGQLSRLTQTMMRNPSHAQLATFVLVKSTKAFFKLLGFRVTKQKLAQLIPIAGVVLNGGMNARSVVSLSERAQQAYRLRFLTEKYGLNPAAWLAQAESPMSEPEGDSIDIEALFEEAEQENQSVPTKPGS